MLAAPVMHTVGKSRSRLQVSAEKYLPSLWMQRRCEGEEKHGRISTGFETQAFYCLLEDAHMIRIPNWNENKSTSNPSTYAFVFSLIILGKPKLSIPTWIALERMRKLKQAINI